MGRPFIVLGDPIDHGGKVISAADTSSLAGKGIARVGDQVLCEQHGLVTIVTGDDSVTIDGRAAARHGDKTSCGATLIASQHTSGIE